MRLISLPTFVFIGEGGVESRLELSRAGGTIRSRAEFLAGSVPAGSAIGLMLPSGPDVVVNWLAAVAAGLRPLVMQYPTAKQARNYWAASVRNTIASVDISAVICDGHSRDLGMAELAHVVPHDVLSALPDGADADIDFGAFEILQLSSGTTGFRKGITLASTVVREHVEAYNQRLGLKPGVDRIVSWLPLYHDMGFIGCFVMPMMLGIDVVMMDPMAWIRRPDMLFHAIERHRATTCWMPNFAYEMLSRGPVRPQPTMRRWICGGEPISAGTARRFCEAIDADPSLFWPLYGMAENVLSLSTRRNIQTQVVDGAEIVCCGPPLPGVEFRIIDGEIWVRAATAIDGYMDGRRIKNAEGFYATGDLGVLVDGELYVSGRKQDLLIQAGRKFLLSDVDLRINELLPEVRGRAVALALRDERLGTESLMALIESADFLVRDDRARIEESLRADCGIDQLGVAFVPPRFLTKTSSGKFNRKASGADWINRGKARESSGQGNDLLALLNHYRDAPPDAQLKDVFDSLSLAVLRSVMRDAHVPYDPQDTLEQVEARVRKSIAEGREEAKPDTIRIVSLAERMIYNQLRPQHFDALSRALGRPVEFEHVCVPPSAILLSDLVFQDYFAARLAPGMFSSLGRVLDKVRNASVILTDDVAEMLWPAEQTYGVLSHSLERDPRADLISFRWQSYARQHDVLPLTIVSGIDIPMEQSSRTLDLVSRYLGVPVFRMANIRGFSDFTAEWEHRPFTAHPYQGMEPDAFIAALGRFILESPRPVPLRAAQGTSLFDQSEPPHYCTTLLDPGVVDQLVDRFDSFLLAGPPSSAPYVRRALEAKRKRHSTAMSFAPEVLANLREPFDCMLMLGAIGPFPIDPQLRVVALQHIGRTWRTQGVENVALPELPDTPPSNHDWFVPFELDRGRNAVYFAVRREVNEATARFRAASPWMAGRSDRSIPACVTPDDMGDPTIIAAPPPATGRANLQETLAKVWPLSQSGAWDDVERLSNDLRRDFPGAPSGHFWGAMALRQLGRHEEAGSILREALPKFPGDQHLLLEAARNAQARGDWREVIEWAARLIADFPVQAAGYLLKCHAHRSLSEWDAAACVHAEGARRLPDEVGIQIEGCWVAIGQQDWQLALERCTNLRAAHPEHESGYRIALLVLKRTRRFAQAGEILAAADARIGPNAWIRAECLQLARQQEDPERVVDLAMKVAESDPGDPFAYEAGSWALRHLGRLDEAEQLLQRAIGILSPHPQILSEHARVAQDRGDWSELDDRWCKAWRQFPDDRVIALSYARSPVPRDKAYAKADVVEAHRRYTEIQDRFPDFGAAYSDHILMFRNAHCPSEAEDVARLACSRLPDDVQIRIEYSEAAAARGDTVAALARLVEAKDRFSDHVAFQCRLAGALAAAGRYGEAEAICEGLLARHGDSEMPHIEYAEIAMRQKDWPTAAERWRTANRRFPKHGRIQKSLFDAEYASLEADTHATGRIFVEVAAPGTDNEGEQPIDEVVARFESLAGTFLGCEFGAVQRYYGIEPLGLFRWGMIDIEDIILAIESRLDGVGSPEQTEMKVAHQEGEGHNETTAEYLLIDTRYRLQSHTFIRASENPYDKMYSQSLRRMQFLKRKMLEDIAEAQKIFVYKRGHAPIVEEQAIRLSRALCAFSPANQLLCVHLATRDGQAGTVERVTPNLLYGYVSHFSLSMGRTPSPRRPAYGEWASICRGALGMWPGAEGIETRSPVVTIEGNADAG